MHWLLLHQQQHSTANGVYVDCRSGASMNFVCLLLFLLRCVFCFAAHAFDTREILWNGVDGLSELSEFFLF